ncbi:MAG: ribose-phosphate pyrophosphokinase, partial [Candidatus Diapherotrites archaeon]
MKNAAILSGNANLGLAGETAKKCGAKLGKVHIEKFPDLETYARIGEPVKGKKVFIIQPTSTPANEHLAELLLLADAARRAGASKIVAVMPYYGYARQDRKVKEGEPVSAQLFAGLLRKAGVDEFIAMDLHSRAVEKFLRPKAHLHALPVIAGYFKSKRIRDLVVVAPDKGALKNVKMQAKALGAKIAAISKKRISGSQVIAEKIEGNIKGKNCVIIDDIISTAGTMCEAVRMLKSNGAASVYVAATHGVLAGKAIERLKAAPVKEVIVTNTIPQAGHKKALKKLRVLSVAPVLAEAMKRI